MPAATAPDVTDDSRLAEFEEIFRQHSRMVYRTARAVTGSSEEAEDIVQTIFLRLIRGDDTANLPANPRAYLHRAAVNLAVDALRTRRRRTFIRDVDRLESPPLGGAAFGAAAHNQLDAALAQLDPKGVELLTLRYIHGYTDAEIAGLLGASRGAIALRLFRLRGRLKKLLRPRAEKKS